MNPSLEIFGVGGALMESHGLKSLFPIQDISVMGLVEVIPHILTIKKRIRQTLDHIIATKPDVIVTIDAPGFCLRVVRLVKKQCKIPVVQYVAPSVWAWKPGRAKKLSQQVDHLLTLFPFEPPYFTRYGLPTTFVGHPVVEQTPQPDPTFRQRHGILPDVPLLCILPGSRQSEIQRLFPIFMETITLLSQQFPTIRGVVPVLPHLLSGVKAQAQSCSVPLTITDTPAEKQAAFMASTAALAANGTVALELARASLSMVVGYRLSPITHFIVKRLVTVDMACPVNLVLNQRIVPERIQHDCTPQNLAQDLVPILKNPQAMKPFLQQAIDFLRGDDVDMPSQLAARIILSYR